MREIFQEPDRYQTMCVSGVWLKTTFDGCIQAFLWEMPAFNMNHQSIGFSDQTKPRMLMGGVTQ